MKSDSYTAGKPKDKYKVWFFAGGETRDDRFNNFTGSYIRLMTEIMEEDFEFIKGIYFRYPMMNVIWALNNAQRPISNLEKEKIFMTAFRQIIDAGLSPETQLIITSSSSGSIVAAQTACYLAQKNRNNIYFRKPFHLVLGASMISSDSKLYKQLLAYQNEGTIGKILHDEVQDEGDTSRGVGGTTRLQAYRNAFGLMFPFLSSKYHGHSFLNTNPVTGHIHRRRSQTVQKAMDYINIILVNNKLAGEHYCDVAKLTLSAVECEQRVEANKF
jgi:hypothetical protein